MTYEGERAGFDIGRLLTSRIVPNLVKSLIIWAMRHNAASAIVDDTIPPTVLIFLKFDFFLGLIELKARSLERLVLVFRLALLQPELEKKSRAHICQASTVAAGEKRLKPILRQRRPVFDRSGTRSNQPSILPTN